MIKIKKDNFEQVMLLINEIYLSDGKNVLILDSEHSDNSEDIKTF